MSGRRRRWRGKGEGASEEANEEVEVNEERGRRELCANINLT